MSESETQMIYESCPDCGEPTALIKLGREPAREICGLFDCSWDGISIT